MSSTDSAIPNVVITGFMGTGKSTVGRLLAERLGYEWVDTDAVIESRHGSIAEIFAANGEEAFREMERSIAEELADREGLVISTGGRMMLDSDIESLLTRNGRVFCLVADAGEVLSRVSKQDGPPRPLLAGANPLERIAGLLSERNQAYQRFEQVPTGGKTVAEVADELETRFRS